MRATSPNWTSSTRTCVYVLGACYTLGELTDDTPTVGGTATIAVSTSARFTGAPSWPDTSEGTSPSQTIFPSTLSSSATSPTGVTPFPTSSPAPPITPRPAPISTATSATTSTEMDVPNSPSTLPFPSANMTSAIPPSPAQSAVPSTTSATPSRVAGHLTTPAFAGALASVALATAAAAALFRFWVRRRRQRAGARRALQLPAQNTGEPAAGILAADRTPFARVLQKRWASEGTPGSRARNESLVSGSSCSALNGSATTLERTPSGSPPPPTPDPEMIQVQSKDCETAGDECPRPAPSFSEPPSTDHVQDRSDGSAGQCDVLQGEIFATAAPEPEMADVQGQRLLHLALPWILGQRVLAFIAREDTRSVESDGSEPLPAYEPRE